MVVLVNRKYRDGAKRFMLESGAKLVPWRIGHIRPAPAERKTREYSGRKV